jgi:CheY-like chemotaxis protein
MRVLLVDDDATVRAVMQRILRRQFSFDIDLCKDGPEALEKLSTEEYALVLLDVTMPMMDGMDVLQSIRLNPDTHHTPVIMITGLSDQRLVKQALREGISDFILKPVRPAELCDRVAKVIEKTGDHRDDGWRLPAVAAAGAAR